MIEIIPKELIEKIEKAKSGIIPVTCDIIAELRAQGLNYEAALLLRTYHDNQKENWEELRREDKIFRQKIYRHKCRIKGICINCGKKNPRSTYICPKCRQKYK